MGKAGGSASGTRKGCGPAIPRQIKELLALSRLLPISLPRTHEELG